MSKRNYSVFFNTHTVSGIVISVALYVIFFAGAFSLFKDEIDIWEKGNSISNTAREQIDFDKILLQLSREINLKSRDIQFNLGHNNDKIFVKIDRAKDTVTFSKKERESASLYVNIDTGKTGTYKENYGLGEFLFRLHFFSQIPYIGAYLSGFISLFFLFAIVTGLIVHWKKIVSNFYQFNLKATLKRVWADAHTALGFIGLPFQFIFAVTGTYFCLSILVLLPANFLYKGDQNKLMADLRPDRKVVEWIGYTKKNHPSVNNFIEENANKWDDFHPKYIKINNYGGVNMKYHLQGELQPNEKFLSTGEISLDTQSGKITLQRNPHKTNYIADIQQTMGRLHFGEFGGIWVKIAYFILSLITCFVIISGVLIWIEARNKKSKTLKQRLYTSKVGHIYLAICLSLFPLIAFSFLIMKLLPVIYYTQKMQILYIGFFFFWIIMSLYYRFKRDNYFTNKSTLIIGAVLGFLVPITNGIVSGNWIWKMYQIKQYEILTVDLLWIFLSFTALFAYTKIKPNVKENSAFTKLPIQYKNIKEQLSKEETKNTLTINSKELNYISMRTKIIILWFFIATGFILHHIYGLATVFFKPSVVLENANGTTPFSIHTYRVLMEGLALLFALATIEISKKWFRTTAFIWSLIVLLFNCYHFITAIIYEPTNFSELFILLLMAITSFLLTKNLNIWMKMNDNKL